MRDESHLADTESTCERTVFIVSEWKSVDTVGVTVPARKWVKEAEALKSVTDSRAKNARILAKHLEYVSNDPIQVKRMEDEVSIRNNGCVKSTMLAFSSLPAPYAN
mgnify:CR=1 FL=1